MPYTARVEQRPRKRGRRPKPPGEKFVTKSFRFDPALWAEVLRWIPTGKRSEIITACLARAVERAKDGEE